MANIKEVVGGRVKPDTAYPIEEIDGDEWRRTMDVNLNGMFYCVQKATPRMKAQKSGTIINISTVSSPIKPVVIKAFSVVFLSFQS